MREPTPGSGNRCIAARSRAPRNWLLGVEGRSVFDDPRLRGAIGRTRPGVAEAGLPRPPARGLISSLAPIWQNRTYRTYRKRSLFYLCPTRAEVAVVSARTPRIAVRAVSNRVEHPPLSATTGVILRRSGAGVGRKSLCGRALRGGDLCSHGQVVVSRKVLACALLGFTLHRSSSRRRRR